MKTTILIFRIGSLVGAVCGLVAALRGDRLGSVSCMVFAAFALLLAHDVGGH